MKKILPIILTLIITNLIIAQSVEIKDTDTNILMGVNDEGSTGSITLPSGGTPNPTTNKLYNEGGTLKWSGAALGTSMGGRISLSHSTAYQAPTDGFVTAYGSTAIDGTLYLFLSSTSTFGTIASFSDYGTSFDRPSFVYPISKGTWWKVTRSSALVSLVDLRWISFGN
ncbi:hypothetical protein ACFLZA_01300 [Candidatus Neomarinimicrobiota bacterium]